LRARNEKRHVRVRERGPIPSSAQHSTAQHRMHHTSTDQQGTGRAISSQTRPYHTSTLQHGPYHTIPAKIVPYHHNTDSASQTRLEQHITARPEQHRTYHARPIQHSTAHTSTDQHSSTRCAPSLPGGMHWTGLDSNISPQATTARHSTARHGAAQHRLHHTYTAQHFLREALRPVLLRSGNGNASGTKEHRAQGLPQEIFNQGCTLPVSVCVCVCVSNGFHPGVYTACVRACVCVCMSVHVCACVGV
jgi:hypothetical protein